MSITELIRAASTHLAVPALSPQNLPFLLETVGAALSQTDITPDARAELETLHARLASIPKQPDRSFPGGCCTKL